MPRDRSFSFTSILEMTESLEEDGVKVDLESSTYSQVVFIDVPPSYPLNTDVICCYKLTGGLIPNPKDWIGIYKVETSLEFLHALKRKICLCSQSEL